MGTGEGGLVCFGGRAGVWFLGLTDTGAPMPPHMGEWLRGCWRWAGGWIPGAAAIGPVAKFTVSVAKVQWG